MKVILAEIIHKSIVFLVAIIIIPISIAVSLIVRVKSYLSSRFKSKNNIFIGITEIASNIQSISTALSNKGYNVYAFIRPSKYSLNIDNNNNKIEVEIVNEFRGKLAIFGMNEIYFSIRFLYYLWNCQIFYFIWQHSFLPLKLDYPIIKIAGHKLIIMHCGDDVRYRPLHESIHNNFGIETTQNRRDHKLLVGNLFFQLWSELFGTVLSLPSQATFQYGKLYHFFFPMRSLTNELYRSGNKIKILHAPSDRIIKATKYVLDAIEILEKSDSNFEFVLLENVPNKIVIDHLIDADIVIDQPSVWVARFAIEACSSGCCVIGGNNADYVRKYDSPILQFERDSIYLAELLYRLINDRAFLERKKKACYEFWELNYSNEAYYENFKLILSNSAPSFYPLKNQKKLVLSGCKTKFEKWFIKLLYHPVK